MAVNLMPPES